MVKLSLAKSTGKLDLSDCQLDDVPKEVFELDLEELTLAGNNIKKLPDAISRLKNLRLLQVAGNKLTELPDGLCKLTKLEGLWLHGNLIKKLPRSFGALKELSVIALVGNCLTELPASLGELHSLTELGLAGNQLKEAPACLGSLSALQKLTLNGNRITKVSPELGHLHKLKELWLQDNLIKELPDELTQMKALEQLNVADNQLAALPIHLYKLRALKLCWLYGNQLTALPMGLAGMAKLQELWIEANPISPDTVKAALKELNDAEDTFQLRDIGFDQNQAKGVDIPRYPKVRSIVKIAEIVGSGKGYFKLKRGREMHHTSDRAEIVDGNGNKGTRVLVVTYASAPGVPNWGGLLKRILAATAEPAHQCFDQMYVVDGSRSWYHGGDKEVVDEWFARMKLATDRYQKVLMLGDSMGGTGALIFSPLATAVQVFCPQVDLLQSSIRPGKDTAWMGALKDRLCAEVAHSSANITIHCSNWQHDLDQGKMLPQEHVQLEVYSVDSHRLALYLDDSHKLLPIVRNAILAEMGYTPKEVRLHNLV
ncbi:hypothetical protein WJX72_010668 [[Myrmecia] bisecta]|uniref:Disease resistance R13L4/SHOC-2-like LRR domain-containing protein n=1 Tax=[Myrmecia] bisecta TaxID=41462 RepID=A0AAW1R9R2_9CHLO